MTRARFRAVSIWDDDDPALVRMREALEPRQPVPEARPATPAPEVDPVPTRDELEALRNRVARGDRSAFDALRRALGRLRHGQ